MSIFLLVLVAVCFGFMTEINLTFDRLAIDSPYITNGDSGDPIDPDDPDDPDDPIDPDDTDDPIDPGRPLPFFADPESRFFKFMDNITTYRYGIWVSVTIQVFSNIENALFGFSVGTPNIGETANGIVGLMPHSTYVDMIFNAGLIGIIILVCLALYLLIPLIKKKEINWWNIFAFLPFLIALGAQSTMPFAFAVYLIVMCPLLTHRTREPPPTETNNEEPKKKQVSFVIPVYKVEPYLHRCIDSILNALQGIEDRYEIVLVDDGCPDNCGKICDEYAKKHKHIMSLHKKNEGQGEARNYGIKHATGEFIAFIDSDDWVTEDLRRLFDYISQNPTVNVFCVGHKTVDGGDKILATSNDMTVGLVDCTNQDFYNLIKYVPPWKKVIRRQFIMDNNLFFIKGRLLEDTGQSFSLFMKCKEVYFTDLNYYRYLLRQTSTMGQFSTKQLDAAVLNIEEGFALKGTLDLPPFANALFRDFFVMHFYGSVFHALKTFPTSETDKITDFVQKNKSHLQFPFNYNIFAKLFWLSSRIIGSKRTVTITHRIIKTIKK